MNRVLPLFCVLCACEPAFVERSSFVRFDLNAGFAAQPLPNVTREDFVDVGAPAADPVWVTGGRALVEGRWDEGFFSVPLSEPIDPDTLPESGDTTRTASMFLMSIDLDSPERGVRLPLRVEQQGSVLFVEPIGVSPQPNTRYALVLTDRIRDEIGSRLGRDRDFNNAFELENDTDLRLRRALVDLRATLVEDGELLASVMGAAMFVTDGGF